MLNIEKIQKMDAEDWLIAATQDNHLIPTLCFMCVGCEDCKENCSMGIYEWLNKESEK